jgi:hypothetical protein
MGAERGKEMKQRQDRGMQWKESRKRKKKV